MFSSWWSKSSASSFSCDLGSPVEGSHTLGAGVFALHSGTRKSNGTPVSNFVCSESDKFSSAVIAVKRLKTLRHPSIVTYVDSGTKALPMKHRRPQEFLQWGGGGVAKTSVTLNTPLKALLLSPPGDPLAWKFVWLCFFGNNFVQICLKMTALLKRFSRNITKDLST